ncbi:unnamed protein product [Adineta ricciae]|uniref:Nuclear receptor domain-containing protein n=1 Tax=Adineta ricciae TaxID=249248 RepID=A0A813UQI1_ADIRI|nr:unnamed protein product [Adineta ricciae]CAF1011512.1 unnamed protein product [Adineta ricciae]
MEEDPSTRTSKSRQLEPCYVCGAKSIGCNFGVLTCMACKAFFRRNAVKLGKIEFICYQNGDCVITHEYRRMCNCCRLAKCFRVGMQRSSILSESEKQARKDLVEQNRRKREEGKLMCHTRKIRSNLNAYSLEKCPKALSSFDQVILTNIFHTYERVYSQKDFEPLTNAPVLKLTAVDTFFNDSEQRVRVLFDFFKLIPEFNKLPIMDRARLVRTNFGPLFHMNESILKRSSHQNFIFSLQAAFGDIGAHEIRISFEREREYLYDPILLKLIMIIWCFSLGMNKYTYNIDTSVIYEDTLAIFASESVYVELLWRYLRSRLPSTEDTIKFFNSFVLNVLWLQRTCLAVDRFMLKSETHVKNMVPLLQCIICPSPNSLRVTEDTSDMNLTNVQ